MSLTRTIGDIIEYFRLNLCQHKTLVSGRQLIFMYVLWQTDIKYIRSINFDIFLQRYGMARMVQGIR